MKCRNHQLYTKTIKERFLLANNRQVDMLTKNIDIGNHFMWGMVEEKYMDIDYISIK